MALQEFLKEKTTAEMYDFADETDVRYGTLYSIRCGERNAGWTVFNKIHLSDPVKYPVHAPTMRFFRPDMTWMD